MTTEYIGGYRFDLERYDDLRAAEMPTSELITAMETPFAIPQSIDPRAYSPVRNQSSEGSCQGHSIMDAAGMCHYGRTGEWKVFCPDWAYYRTQRKDGLLGRDVGSTIAGGVWVVRSLGALPESDGPGYSPRYNPNDFPASLDAKAAPFKVSKYATLRSYSEIVNWLGRGLGGVSWGIRWGIQPDRNGNITSYRPGGGGHATSLAGYGPLWSDGMPEFLWLKNSWGQSWGMGGWARIYRQAVEQALRDSYTVIGAISDMDDVKPRKVDWIKESINA